VKAALSRRRDERGQALLIALGFVAMFGVIAASLGSYATANLMSSERLRNVRSAQFAVDGAVKTAVNWAQSDANIPASAVSATTNCFRSQSINGVTVQVVCQATAPGPATPPTSGVTVQTVTFYGCRSTVPTCDASTALLVAQAQISRVLSVTRSLTVTSWSVKK
jgi:hypothetical protein